MDIETLKKIFQETNSWDEMESRINELGCRYVLKGGGAVIRSADGEEIKASVVWRQASLFYLQKRFGPYGEANGGRKSMSWGAVEAQRMKMLKLRNEIMELLIDGRDMDWVCSRVGHENAPLVRKYQAKLLAGKTFRPSVTTFEAWLSLKKTDPAKFSIPEPDLYRLLTVREKIREICEFHKALEADGYLVICKKMAERKEDEKAMLLHRKDGFPEGYPLKQLLKKLPRLINFEARGEHVYLTPKSRYYSYFIVDDVEEDQLGLMECLGASCIVCTSPGNFQADFRFPAEVCDREIVNEICRGLNNAYGDPGFSGAVHPQRAPGFANPKPAYVREGRSPVACCAASMPGREFALAAKYAAWLEGNRPCVKLTDYGTHARQYTDEEALAIYEAHRDAHTAYVRKALQNNMMPRRESDSQVDYQIAVRLRGTGHTQEDIARILELAGRQTQRGHRWEDYARRTAKSAWKEMADRSLQSRERWISEWAEIEDRALKELREKQPPKGPSM